jgi:lysophospholipase L1-like esterase
MSNGPGSEAIEKPARRSRRRRPLLVGVVASFALCAALIAGEILLRSYVWFRGWTFNCYAASLELFRPDAEVGYDLRPDFHLVSGVFRISTNSLGLRGPEVATAKPKGVVRIAILGGSSAFGYLVSDGAEAARLLEERLRAEGHNVQVLNAGVPGYNLNQTIPRFNEVVAPLEPDIVVTYLGWNDLAYAASSTPTARRFRVRPVASAWKRALAQSVLFAFVLYRLLGQSLDFAPPEMSARRPTEAGAEQFKENLARLALDVRRSGAALVVCAQASASHAEVSDELNERLRPPPESFGDAQPGKWLRDTLESFARRQGAAFVDAYSAMPPTGAMLAEYIHRTAEGERRLADLLAARLAPMLSQRKASGKRAETDRRAPAPTRSAVK